MKIKSAELELSASDLSGCPPAQVPEIALIGRSNVGKSSLVNLLTHRRSLARTSNTPGKTQLLNFYRINAACRLVDLPGYGYAKVGREQQLGFNQAVAEYLARRGTLRRVLVLIDSRLPAQAIDLEFIEWIDGIGRPYSLVFTKADKLSGTQVEAKLAQYTAALRAAGRSVPEVFVSSAETGTGRTELLAQIARDIAAP